MLKRKEVKKLVRENKETLINNDYGEDVVKTIYEMLEGKDFNFDLDYAENEMEAYIQATVYIKNMIGDGNGYTVIIEHDFPITFIDEEHAVDCIMEMEERAIKLLKYFKS